MLYGRKRRCKSRFSRSDKFNTTIGKTFAGWAILVLTFAISYEVFARYVLRAPTTWAFDVSYMLYGTLFMLAGAYALARNAHVRGDFLYRTWCRGGAGEAWTWSSTSCSSSPASSPSPGAGIPVRRASPG